MSDHPGMGVMLGMLGGNEESAKTFASAVGKKIVALELVDDELRFTMEDGSRFKLMDDGQSCCESRYLRTDDDLSYHVGAELREAVVKPAPSIADKYGEHEVSFLDVTTSKGTFQIAAHNEHNGYYGGFWIIAEPLPAASEDR